MYLFFNLSPNHSLFISLSHSVSSYLLSLSIFSILLSLSLIASQAKAIGLVALSAFSKRAGKKARNIFIDTINNGGLSLLNELVIDASGHEIVAVMKLVADASNYPIGLFCTAGESVHVQVIVSMSYEH